MTCAKCGSDFPTTNVPEWLSGEPWLCRTCQSASAAVERAGGQGNTVYPSRGGGWVDAGKVAATAKVRAQELEAKHADEILFQARECARKEAH